MIQNPPPVFLCQKCNKRFKTGASLKEHQRATGHNSQGIAVKMRGNLSNAAVTAEFLAFREQRAAAKGFPKAKWIFFCEEMLRAGLSVNLYEAKRTVSKYITVSHGGKSFKVRFSNHLPIKSREEAADCDFFVGICNTTTTTTPQAIAATFAFFAMQGAA